LIAKLLSSLFIMVHIKHSAAFILAVAAAMIVPAVALPVPTLPSFIDHKDWHIAKHLSELHPMLGVYPLSYSKTVVSAIESL
jgi:hypothetical protein